ncbi:MAG TPA: hypothetical protein VJW20_14345 [Candidatus Angelobacter sp.]|nr:hypothetical protein [Candidatus Angelobacter sp.]
MRIFFLFFLTFSIPAIAQSVKPFPPPEAILADDKHHEPKSGVQIGPGNTITIQSGVGTPSTINVLAFSRDGKWLAAGKDFGRVVIWDVTKQKFARAFETRQGIIKAVALSKDGAILATAGDKDDYSLKLWNVQNGKLLKTFKASTDFIHSVSFGPDGRWLMVSDNTARTYVLEIASGKQLLDLKDMWGPVLSPDGRTFMVVGKKIFVSWNTADWTQTATVPQGENYPVAMGLLPEADTFVAGLFDGSFHLYKLSTGEVLPTAPLSPLPKFNLAAGGFASFGPGNTIFGHSDGQLWLWDTHTGQTCVSAVMYSESGALSSDGTLLAGAKANSILAQTRSGEGVWLWDTAKLRAACGLTRQAAR